MSFWRSSEGRLAIDMLQAWGEKGQIDALGGLALVTGSGAGARGKPGDVSTIFQLAVSVDMAIRAWDECKEFSRRSNLLPRLLTFMYRDGMRKQLTEVSYVFPDGQRTTLSPWEAEERTPHGFCEREEQWGTVYTYDLATFPAADVDLLMDTFYPNAPRYRARYRELFLRRMHEDFAGFLADRCPVVRLAPDGPAACSHAVEIGQPEYTVPTVAEVAMAKKAFVAYMESSVGLGPTESPLGAELLRSEAQ